ncbi:UNKNOWN [Stylonychia lemnae]|uniref:Uncharacterized protein n=1 Tax=Stylonychia lemnae TaxID=5949 RepID=A0A078BFG8_STYLE|nr:UNKNOWN [Stylonychia lemnae]|eukprot:CDW91872.1 UNKNOWN [Stylonychia lemnae]
MKDNIRSRIISQLIYACLINHFIANAQQIDCFQDRYPMIFRFNEYTAIKTIYTTSNGELYFGGATQDDIANRQSNADKPIYGMINSDSSIAWIYTISDLSGHVVQIQYQETTDPLTSLVYMMINTPNQYYTIAITNRFGQVPQYLEPQNLYFNQSNSLSKFSFFATENGQIYHITVPNITDGSLFYRLFQIDKITFNTATQLYQSNSIIRSKNLKAYRFRAVLMKYFEDTLFIGGEFDANLNDQMRNPGSLRINFDDQVMENDGLLLIGFQKQDYIIIFHDVMRSTLTNNITQYFEMKGTDDGQSAMMIYMQDNKLYYDELSFDNGKLKKTIINQFLYKQLVSSYITS